MVVNLYANKIYNEKAYVQNSDSFLATFDYYTDGKFPYKLPFN